MDHPGDPEQAAAASDPSGPTRRAALASLGAAGLALVVAACSDGDPESSPATTTTPSSRSTTTSAAGSSPTTTTLAPDCVLSPEMTEGPYYLDVDLVRSDITDGRPGEPLALSLTVVDADGCAPIADAAVDLWHADASGEYSGVGGGSSGATFCRGTQQTDAQGRCRFTTIYPGWYGGRATHIHLKVHVGGDVVHTGQLFFPDELNAEVATRAPYSSRGEPDVTNETDSIYRDGGSSSTLDPHPASKGFDAAMTLGVRRQGGDAESLT